MKFAKQKILKPNVLIVAMIVLALAGYIILGVFYMGEESDQDDITSAFFTHGLAVQITETAAAYMHNHIRKELNLEERQGKRYSWGFPAIPDLSQHKQLFKLLPAQEELNIQLTSAFQFVPEYTTAALIVHHPQAQYYQINQK